MTSLDFIVAMQEYYGIAYSKLQVKYVKEWLDKSSDQWREALLAVTLLKYKGVTLKGDRYLPNIAILAELADDVRKVIVEKNGH